jgi:hypothetical protein
MALETSKDSLFRLVALPRCLATDNNSLLIKFPQNVKLFNVIPTLRGEQSGKMENPFTKLLSWQLEQTSMSHCSQCHKANVSHSHLLHSCA